jgi:hypothetical protein
MIPDVAVQTAITMLRNGGTLAAAARALGIHYRQVQKAVCKTLGPEGYREAMKRKGKLYKPFPEDFPERVE